MTPDVTVSPPPGDIDRLLAEALREAAHVCGWDVPCPCADWPDEQYDAAVHATAVSAGHVNEVQGSPEAFAAVLAPVVSQIAARRAAEELRAAAAALTSGTGYGPYYADWLRDRAQQIENPTGGETTVTVFDAAARDLRDKLTVVLDGDNGNDGALLDALAPVVQEHAARRAAEALNRLAHDLLDRQAKAVVRAAAHADDEDQDTWLRDIGRSSGYGSSAHLARLAAAALAAAAPTTDPKEQDR